MNHPLETGNGSVFLLGNGYAPRITVRDGEGTVLYSDATPFLPQDNNYTSVGAVKVPGASPEQLGFAGFWGLPLLLQAAVDYDRTLFGDYLFLFVSWIFINVHHYFIDNVLWRRDNPETKRWLFGA